MGGFNFEGPTKIIKYKHMSKIRCNCPGVITSITKEQEDKFIEKENSSMTLEEFHSIFENKYINSHIHIRDPREPNPDTLYFTIEDKNIKIINYLVNYFKF